MGFLTDTTLIWYTCGRSDLPAKSAGIRANRAMGFRVLHIFYGETNDKHGDTCFVFVLWAGGRPAGWLQQFLLLCWMREWIWIADMAKYIQVCDRARGLLRLHHGC